MSGLSVIIPARNEIYLEHTVRNVLENAEGDIEVMVVLDGYEPPPLSFESNPKVKVLRFLEPQGHRRATNWGARHAQGEFVMKLDAHCAVGKGFDRILASEYEPDWTVVPRMYNLDTETWKPKHFDDFNTAVRKRKMHDYLYMGMHESGEFRVAYYPHTINKQMHHERHGILIDETMACMGCSFFMSRDRYWELGGCDETMGTWGQQACEVSCKAWLSGGKLMVNKKTWFAHWFRGGQGFPYPISGQTIARNREYSKDYWLNNRWPKQKHRLSWLMEKFKAPTWEQFLEPVAA